VQDEQAYLGFLLLGRIIVDRFHRGVLKRDAELVGCHSEVAGSIAAVALALGDLELVGLLGSGAVPVREELLEMARRITVANGRL
jgi:hypothetical protein